MAERVRYQGNIPTLATFIARMPLVLAGRLPDVFGLRRGMMARLGSAFFAKAQQAFLVKSLGGTGDDGITWPRLKVATVAARRTTAKERAAAKKLKKAGGPQTKRGLFGARKVNILRDTGKLYRSLTPGVEDRPPRRQGQVFVLTATGVLVGTSEKPWHHRGVSGKLPARPFWPLDNSIPKTWWKSILAAYANGLAKVVARMIAQRRIRP